MSLNDTLKSSQCASVDFSENIIFNRYFGLLWKLWIIRNGRCSSIHCQFFRHLILSFHKIFWAHYFSFFFKRTCCWKQKRKLILRSQKAYAYAEMEARTCTREMTTSSIEHWMPELKVYKWYPGKRGTNICGTCIMKCSEYGVKVLKWDDEGPIREQYLKSSSKDLFVLDGNVD